MKNGGAYWVARLEMGFESELLLPIAAQIATQAHSSLAEPQSNTQTGQPSESQRKKGFSGFQNVRLFMLHSTGHCAQHGHRIRAQLC